jgi:hypothetical protein
MASTIGVSAQMRCTGAERAGPVLPGFCRRDAFGITIGAGVLYLGAIAEGWACARTQDPSRS